MRIWRSGASKWDRALAITLVAGVGMMLLVGLVFAIAYGSQQITTNATALHQADESLRAATVDPALETNQIRDCPEGSTLTPVCQ